MPRLNDAGMHRTDGDFMHTVSLHAHKRIVGQERWTNSASALLQGKVIRWPGTVVQPGPRIAGTLCLHPRQIGCGTLHARGHRKQRHQIRIDLLTAHQCQRHGQPERALQRGVAGAHVGGAGPQRQQASATLAHGGGCA